MVTKFGPRGEQYQISPDNITTRSINLFTDTAAILNFFRFKEYYGMPRGHSPSIYTLFLGKKRTSNVYFAGKGNHNYIQTRHNDLFFPLQFFSLGKLKEKLSRKARLNTERVYRIVPTGYQIILLKTN